MPKFFEGRARAAFVGWGGNLFVVLHYKELDAGTRLVDLSVWLSFSF